VCVCICRSGKELNEGNVSIDKGSGTGVKTIAELNLA